MSTPRTTPRNTTGSMGLQPERDGAMGCRKPTRAADRKLTTKPRAELEPVPVPFREDDRAKRLAVGRTWNSCPCRLPAGASASRHTRRLHRRRAAALVLTARSASTERPRLGDRSRGVSRWGPAQNLREFCVSRTDPQPRLADDLAAPGCPYTAGSWAQRSRCQCSEWLSWHPAAGCPSGSARRLTKAQFNKGPAGHRFVSAHTAITQRDIDRTPTQLAGPVQRTPRRDRQAMKLHTR